MEITVTPDQLAFLQSICEAAAAQTTQQQQTAPTAATTTATPTRPTATPQTKPTDATTPQRTAPPRSAKKQSSSPAKLHTIAAFPAGTEGYILYNGKIREIVSQGANHPWVSVKLTDAHGEDQNKVFNYKPSGIAFRSELDVSLQPDTALPSNRTQEDFTQEEDISLTALEDTE